VSEIVRELFDEHVKNRDIGSYVDNLLGRIGGQIKSKGFDQKEIEGIIRDVRANKCLNSKQFIDFYSIL
jgi:hypothetical protein